MASIKIKFKPSTLKDHPGSIFYQIIKERRVKQVFTNYYIFTNEWDEKRSTVKTVADAGRGSALQLIKEKIRWDINRINKIIREFEEMEAPYSSEDIVERFLQARKECSLFIYMEDVIAKLKANGKVRTSETYQAALNSFKKFRENEDVNLHEISACMMGDYECWLSSRSISTNTISFYMRILRATYNRAVESDIIEDRRPFRHVYTGIDKTVKRALSINIIRRIKLLDLSCTPKLDFARDMFLLSFMMRGMSFVDMAFLKKRDMWNGCITYRRRKTGQLLNIEWTHDMQAILKKYPENKTEYLLPIITMKGYSDRSIYRNVNAKVNYALKQIAQMVGVNIPLTLYVARHSWASAAKKKGIPLRVISEGLGHDSETTTQIYLASLDTSVINKANKLILASI